MKWCGKHVSVAISNLKEFNLFMHNLNHFANILWKCVFYNFSVKETVGGLFTAKPTSYSVLLVPNDGINEETAIHRATIDEMDRNSIDLGLQPLPLRRRWNYTVIAYNRNQHPLTSTAELSEWHIAPWLYCMHSLLHHGIIARNFGKH